MQPEINLQQSLQLAASQDKQSLLQGQKNLAELQKIPGYPLALLSVLAMPNLLENVQLLTVIELKNYILKHWNSVSFFSSIFFFVIDLIKI
jgi:hypothetical protein